MHTRTHNTRTHALSAVTSPREYSFTSLLMVAALSSHPAACCRMATPPIFGPHSSKASELEHPVNSLFSSVVCVLQSPLLAMP